MVRLPLTPAEVERGQRLGALLRRARGERSMLETALDARVSPETLRKIESGRVATPAFPTIAAIADVLGLSLDAVWAEISQPERHVEPAGSGRGTREPVGPASLESAAEPETPTGEHVGTGPTPHAHPARLTTPG
ncbi:helix-turn-helix domain-containing protein [Nonomuraea sp. SBT364]|uniref:helix-turn-helix domain-containing protein n=1 Tax=Nonomuraea sp. SBT364 TaxID=1580530 RepID=UPI000AB5415C